MVVQNVYPEKNNLNNLCGMKYILYRKLKQQNNKNIKSTVGLCLDSTTQASYQNQRIFTKTNNLNNSYGMKYILYQKIK